MEPKLPTPDRRVGQAPVEYGRYGDYLPQENSPERASEQGSERLERRGEATPATVQAPVLPPPVTAPAPPVPSDTAQTDAPASDTPLVANDDDLIEKEWVDKAKKIIVETRDDPFRREQEVGKLQADYLRKRYGKELGTPD